MTATTWANRVFLRDGTTRLVGPYGSKAEAEANRPAGPQVLSVRTVAVGGLDGSPRVLDQKIVHPSAAEFEVTGVNSPDVGQLRMIGRGFSNLELLVVYYNGGSEELLFLPPFDVDSDTQTVVTSATLEGETVTKLELWDGEKLSLTVDGLNVPIGAPSGNVITDVVWTQGVGFTITGDGGFDALQQANTPLTFYFTEFPGGDPLDWQPNNGFGILRDSNTQARIFYGSVQSWNGVGGNSRLDCTLTEIRNGAEVLWTGSVFTGLPQFTAVDSPDVDTIRVTGTALDQLSIVAPVFTNAQSVAWANPSVNPSAAAINSGNGNTILSWTATEIQVTNTFHDGKTVASVDGYLLGSGTPDVSFDCPDVPVTSTPAPAAGYRLFPGENKDVARAVGRDSLGGYFALYDNGILGGGSNAGVLKLTSTGGTDSAWGAAGIHNLPTVAYGMGTALAVGPDDSLYVAWVDDQYNTPQAHVRKLQPDGQVDTNFAEQGFAGTIIDSCLIWDAGNNLLVAGIGDAWNQGGAGHLKRYDSDGNDYDSVNGLPYAVVGVVPLGGVEYLVAMRDIVNTGNMYLTVVEFTTYTFSTPISLAGSIQCTGSGSLPLTLDTDTGNVYAIGRDNGFSNAAFARFDAGNAYNLDPTFGTGGVFVLNLANTGTEQSYLDFILNLDPGHNLAAQDGGFAAVGLLGPSNAVPGNWGVAKLATTGVLDTNYGGGDGLAEIAYIPNQPTDQDGTIYGAVADGNKLFVGGYAYVSGQFIMSIGRLDHVGDFDPTFTGS